MDKPAALSSRYRFDIDAMPIGQWIQARFFAVSFGTPSYGRRHLILIPSLLAV